MTIAIYQTAGRRVEVANSFIGVELTGSAMAFSQFNFQPAWPGLKVTGVLSMRMESSVLASLSGRAKIPPPATPIQHGV